MKYERMKRNIPLGMGFNPDDIVKLRKWAKKIDRAIREVRDLYAVNLSRDLPRDFANKLDDFSGAANNNLLALWYMINDAVGV